MKNGLHNFLEPKVTPLMSYIVPLTDLFCNFCLTNYFKNQSIIKIVAYKFSVEYLINLTN